MNKNREALMCGTVDIASASRTEDSGSNPVFVFKEKHNIPVVYK
jgi:hypothetical protein